MNSTFSKPRSVRATSFLLTVLLLTTTLAAQELALERAKFLTVVGRAKVVDLPLFPLAERVGRVFTQEILEPGAEDLRLHFLIDRPGEDWALYVRQSEGDILWFTTADSDLGDEFWSDELPGNKLTVEIHSSRPANPLKLRIDKIAIGEPDVKPVSITGLDQRSPIHAQEDWIVELGRSVARLRFVGNDDKIYVCTAFLVSPDLLWTNQHCISNESEAKSALVDFDYDRAGVIGQTLRLSQLIETNYKLDYAIVRLSELAGRTPLELDITRPADEEQLLIIQHPGGEPKQVSIADCRVDGPQVVGRGGDETDFGHQCDTLGGSSGSPVFHFERRRVVGLHHLGFNQANGNPFNRASHVDLILAALKPGVRAEIEAVQGFLASE